MTAFDLEFHGDITSSRWGLVGRFMLRDGASSPEGTRSIAPAVIAPPYGRRSLSLLLHGDD